VKLVDFIELGSYVLPENQRNYFKQSLGQLYETEREIKQIISILAEDDSIVKIISVGDVTTQVLLNNKLIPDLAVIDEHVQRKRIPLFDISNFKIIEAENPAGTITSEAWCEIKKALKICDIKIIIRINGEEDLLVLPVIYEAPLNSKVLYGQPNEGLVVVTVNETIKQKIQNLMQKMVKIDEN